MTHSAQDRNSMSARALVVCGLFFLIALAPLMTGSALLSSVAGEPPPDGATVAEEARWAWGKALVPIGGALALLWALLVPVFRGRIGLRLAGALGVAIGGLAVALFLAFLAWGASRG